MEPSGHGTTCIICRSMRSMNLRIHTTCPFTVRAIRCQVIGVNGIWSVFGHSTRPQWSPVDLGPDSYYIYTNRCEIFNCEVSRIHIEMMLFHPCSPLCPFHRLMASGVAHGGVSDPLRHLCVRGIDGGNFLSVLMAPCHCQVTSPDNGEPLDREALALWPVTRRTVMSRHCYENARLLQVARGSCNSCKKKRKMEYLGVLDRIR